MVSQWGSVYFDIQCRSGVKTKRRNELKTDFCHLIQAWCGPRWQSILSTLRDNPPRDPDPHDQYPAVPNKPAKMQKYLVKKVWPYIAAEGGSDLTEYELEQRDPDYYCISSTHLICYHGFTFRDEHHEQVMVCEMEPLLIVCASPTALNA